MQSEAKYTMSKLNFVDLAGSERLGKTKVFQHVLLNCSLALVAPLFKLPNSNTRYLFALFEVPLSKLKLKLTPFDIAHHSKGLPFQVRLTVSTNYSCV